MSIDITKNTATDCPDDVLDKLLAENRRLRIELKQLQRREDSFYNLMEKLMMDVKKTT